MQRVTIVAELIVQSNNKRHSNIYERTSNQKACKYGTNFDSVFVNVVCLISASAHFDSRSALPQGIFRPMSSEHVRVHVDSLCLHSTRDYISTGDG